MKRILIAAFCAIIPALLFAQEPKLSAIKIEGLKNVKEKTVKSELKSKAGKPYSEDKVKTDIQSILALGSFDDVEVSLDTATWRLTYIVSEKPYIKKVVFKGNKQFSNGRLKDESTLKEKEFYDAVKLDESRLKIETLYADKGYADRSVEVYPTIDESSNQMTVSFLITEGNRILIGDVKVNGVKSFKPKKILKLMKTRRKKVFKEDTLRNDIDEIEKFYKNNGFVEAKVSEPVITYNAERTRMTIELTVTEGPKYKFGAFSFSGNTIFSSAELHRALTVKSGQLYQEELLTESRQAILEMYADRGYLNAQVEPQFIKDQAKNIMDVEFNIIEGQIVYLGNLYVDGLVSTKEFVIRREVLLKPGDVFSAGKVRRSIEKVYNLGFIDSVEPQLQPTDQPQQVDLTMNVTEGKPGMLSAGAGYSSVDYLVGTLQVQHMNLFGRAQRLNLMWEFGARRWNYQIDWTEPWFLGKPMSLGTSVFDTLRTQAYGSVSDAWKEGRKGGTVRVGPRLSDRLSLQFTYSYEAVEVNDINTVALTTPTVKSLQDSGILTNGITSSVIGQIVWDTRDNIFDASRGNRQSLSLQYAGLGGTVHFIKPMVRSSWFFPTFWKFVLSLNANAGYIKSLPGSETVPNFERFYVGGAETVRGYKYREEIGPIDGGTLMTVFNAEYKFPIVQEKRRTILQGAFFYDVGGAWLDPQDFRLVIGQGDTDLKSGVGFGIRFTTPVFPIRLDWGYGLNHRTNEEYTQFYFTIGNIF